VLVADAVADFAKRTGFRIVLADADKAKLASRKLTLDTGTEVTYWEALRAALATGPASSRSRRTPMPAELSIPTRILAGVVASSG